MRNRWKTVVLQLLLAACMSFTLAHANTLTFTLNNANQTATPGDTVTFQATVAANAGNTADLYLNGLSGNSDSTLAVDETDFLNNFPFTLSAGDTLTGDIFTVTLPLGAVSGAIYTGSVSLQGGADGSAQDILGSADFSVNVLAVSGAQVPEPCSIFLLGTGLAGLAASRYRRTSATAPGTEA